MNHAMVDVSSALDEVIVKLVPAVRALTRWKPTVPPSACEVRKMRLEAVTAVVETVTAPVVSAAVPIFALLPSFILSPLPAVDDTRSPPKSELNWIILPDVMTRLPVPSADTATNSPLP